MFHSNAISLFDLQCNDFNRSHPRFFNQSEANSFTMNFDFVVLKPIKKLTFIFRPWEQTRQIQNFIDKYFEAAAFDFLTVSTVLQLKKEP